MSEQEPAVKHSICWNCRSAFECLQAEAVETEACSAYNERPKPPGPARVPNAEVARKLWDNTPKHLHPKPWTPTNQTKLERRITELEHREQRLLRQNHALGELYAKAMAARARLTARLRSVLGESLHLSPEEVDDEIADALAEGAEEAR